MQAEMKKQFDQGRQMAQAWLSGFHEAGGSEAYLGVSLAYLAGEAPIFLVFPMNDDANAQAMRELVSGVLPDPQMRMKIVDGHLIAAPQHVLEKIEIQPGAAPKVLGEALHSDDHATLRAVFTPYQDVARVINELMPTLPPQLGGGPSSDLTSGMQWARLTLTTRPKVSLNITIQATDAAAAARVKPVIDRMLTAVVNQAEINQGLVQAAKTLSPKVKGDQLVVQLDEPQLRDLMQRVLGPEILRARDQAKRTVALSNARQLVLMAIMYAADHKDKYPEHFVDFVSYGSGLQPFVHPMSDMTAPVDADKMSQDELRKWLNDNAGFVYIKPAVPMNKLKEPHKIIVIHDKAVYAPDQAVVAFADGHAEVMPRERLEKML
ncbi:MAG: hypothetical protein MJA84_09645, partial [Firmicutes bacterium]|nr:hypothetical protein [Bacillota bacterium]